MTSPTPPPPTPPSFFERFERALSQDRLGPYRNRAQCPDAEVLANYLWNVALCEALYPALHGVEVGLRNAIHQGATDIFRSDRWFEASYPGLDPREQVKLAEAKAELADQRKPETSGRIVAALSFGFWTTLLDLRYERVLWQGGLLRAAFPGVPRPIRTRRDISARFQSIRKFRNRVFHHEPIWSNPLLAQRHTELWEALTWLSPEFADLLRPLDRFAQVHAAGAAAFLAHTTALTTPPPPPAPPAASAPAPGPEGGPDASG